MEKFFIMLAGVCFFLYGMTLAKDGLQHSSSDTVRNVLYKLTNSPLKAVFLGTVATFILQSSSASTVMLVGFANVGLINVSNGLAVALGAGIGTSLFVVLLAQVLSIPLKAYATLMLFFGFVLTQVSRKRGINLGKILLGFGFILYGIKTIAEIATLIKGYPMVTEQLANFAAHPIYAVVVSAILTTVMQSSTATIGILLSLALAGSMSLEAAIPIVLGANIGTTSTALLASLQSNEFGRRIAVGQFLMKVIGVAVFLPFLEPFTGLLQNSAANITMQVALAHLIFNTLGALVLCPFVGLFANALNKLLPQDLVGEEIFRSKYLDKTVLDTPALAFGNVMREINRMANQTQDMFVQVLATLKEERLELIDELEATDDKVDTLCRDIKFYLAQLSQGSLSEEQARRELDLVSVTTYLEEIGDVINRNLGGLARKKIKKQLRFSEEGWQEIKEFHDTVMQNMNLAITAFTTNNEELAKKVRRIKKHVNGSYEDLIQGHLQRLHEGVKASLATSSLHMDLLANMLRVNTIISRIVQPVLKNNPSEE